MPAWSCVYYYLAAMSIGMIALGNLSVGWHSARQPDGAQASYPMVLQQVTQRGTLGFHLGELVTHQQPR